MNHKNWLLKLLWASKLKSLALILVIVCLMPMFAVASADVEKAFLDACINYYSGDYRQCFSVVQSFDQARITPAKDNEYWHSMTYAFGAMAIDAIEQQTVEPNDQLAITKLTWAMHSVSELDSWLDENSKDLRSSEIAYEYISATIIAATLEFIISETAQDYNNDKESKKAIKAAQKLLDKAYKVTYKNRQEWADNPDVRLSILNLAATHLAVQSLHKSSAKSICRTILPEFWEAVEFAVSESERTNNKLLISTASGAIQSMLNLLQLQDYSKDTSIISDILDFSLKARDFRLYASGAKQYRGFIKTNWKSIQSSLLPGEYCIEHFEGPVAPGMYFLKSNKTTKYRNYAFVWNNRMTVPEVWKRGYRDKIESQGFTGVKMGYPDLKKMYSTGTDAMTLTDYVGIDDQIYRVHSLSSLLHKHTTSDTYASSFIGEINYTFGGNETGADGDKGTVRSTGYKGFETDAQLRDIISKSLDEVNILNGDNVSIASVINTLKNSSIVHISTHGQYDNEAFSYMNKSATLDLFTGENILKSCKLILSGYNNNHANYLDAYTISQMDLSNIDILFLDACQTAAGKKIIVGSFTFAEAFNDAGVKNIIAVLDPISPQVTLAFATRFYGLIKDGHSCHDAFYQSKREICPTARIILWE